MNQWFENLSPRERLMVGLATAALLAALFYLLAWEPVHRDLSQLRQQVASHQQDLLWMRGAAGQVATLKSRQDSRPAASGGSLLTLVEKTANDAGLKRHVARVEPQGRDGVRIWLEDAPFDELVRWLGRLRSENGLLVENLSADRPEAPGRVNARLLLRRSGQ